MRKSERKGENTTKTPVCDTEQIGKQQKGWLVAHEPFPDADL